MLKFRLGLCAALSLSLGLLAGCGGARNPNAPAKISGLVKYQGKPVPGGNIVFHTKDNQGMYRCSLGADGTYQIADVPTGNLVVTVETESLNPSKKKGPAYPGGGAAKGSKLDAEYMAGMKKGGAPVNATPAVYQRIPEKYAKAETSPLTVSVEAGSQTHDITLTD